MPTDTELAYLELRADARLEVRLPRALKEHAELAAAARSEKLSDFVVEALAERVSRELAAARRWKLTVPEQTELLRILSAKRTTAPAMNRATKRAAALFGRSALRQR